METSLEDEAVRPAAAPARQRWRLYVSQPAATSPGEQAGGARGWATVLAASRLPLAGEPSGRGRVAPAVPLPLGIAGEREVVDVLLAERLPTDVVREAVRAALPAGWTLVDLHDVWLGAPAAPAAVVAADYRVVVRGPSRAALEAAARELLAAGALPRERRREKRTVAYDLRPLLLALAVRRGTVGGVASEPTSVRLADGAGGSGAALGDVVLAMRLRHGQDAVGRPEEVVAALGEPPAPPLTKSLEVAAIVRERVVMADDPDAPGGDAGSS